MKVVEVGLRAGETGFSFFGIDEVNDLLRQGRQVGAIEPGAAIMEKRGEDSEKVRLGFVGFKVNVLFGDE